MKLKEGFFKQGLAEETLGKGWEEANISICSMYIHTLQARLSGSICFLTLNFSQISTPLYSFFETLFLLNFLYPYRSFSIHFFDSISISLSLFSLPSSFCSCFFLFLPFLIILLSQFSVSFLMFKVPFALSTLFRPSSFLQPLWNSVFLDVSLILRHFCLLLIAAYTSLIL